jgi:2-C-methyl-D-erythritol 2,4-cyclodiphosphate synthase
MNFRIGYGYDVHRLAEGETLWLGGVLVPHLKGTIAHSDGDVLIHALCDAMLGAAKLGDIGRHFPDTSAEYKNIDSKILLARTNDLIAAKKYKVGNLDVTIAAQKPKLKPFIPEMEQTIAGILGIDVDAVSVKATTTEELGFEGREEGISVHAIVLLESLSEK